MESELEITNGDATYAISSILFSPNRDYLVRNNGDQVKFDDFRGKIIGLYFSASTCGPCQDFTPKLAGVYNELAQIENSKFEVVLISGDKDNKSFNAYFSKMPWLAIPFSDSDTRAKLYELFGVNGIPHLVILNENGKMLTSEGVDVIQENGADGYPFTPEHIEKLKKQEEEAKNMNQSLESLLVTQSRDYVITSNGKRVPVVDLIGKDVLLYFSAHWCPSCRDFLPTLTKAYQEINKDNNNKKIEVIFVSSDRDKKSFEEYFSEMPWLAVPFGDERKESLSRHFKVKGFPTLVAIDPKGKTVNTDATGLMKSFGAEAYPFTRERIEEIGIEYDKMAEGWARNLRCGSHDHELFLTKRRGFDCGGCGEEGYFWSYCCGECDFNLHPKCAFDEESKVGGEELVCEDGDMCYKE